MNSPPPKPNANEVFRDVLSKLKEPKPLEEGAVHSEELERIARMVVRDSLIDLGLTLTRAEDLASHHSGCARVRMAKCCRILRIPFSGVIKK